MSEVADRVFQTVHEIMARYAPTSSGLQASRERAARDETQDAVDLGRCLANEFKDRLDGIQRRKHG